MNEFIQTANMIIGIAFTVAYFCQIVYTIVGLVRKPKKYPETDQTKKYAVLISARNEEKVIANLLERIRKQE